MKAVTEIRCGCRCACGAIQTRWGHVSDSASLITPLSLLVRRANCIDQALDHLVLPVIAATTRQTRRLRTRLPLRPVNMSLGRTAALVFFLFRRTLGAQAGSQRFASHAYTRLLRVGWLRVRKPGWLILMKNILLIASALASVEALL